MGYKERDAVSPSIGLLEVGSKREEADVRSDNVLGGDGVDRVEPECAEDIPRAHLPAVLVLR